MADRLSIAHGCYVRLDTAIDKSIKSAWVSVMHRRKKTVRLGSAGGPSLSPDELSSRQREILRVIVAENVRGAGPVSSRTVSKRMTRNLSSASIRATMADLEEMGLLTQLHASAGREPTDCCHPLLLRCHIKRRLLGQLAVAGVGRCNSAGCR